MASNSAGSSPGMTTVPAHRPCLRPFRRTAARPSGVLGPVECCAFRRFASIFDSDGMAHLWRSDCLDLELPFDCIVHDEVEKQGGCGGGEWALSSLFTCS